MELSRIKFNLNRKVLHDGSEYILSGVIYRRNKRSGEFYYQAELIDVKAQNSLLYCDLNTVTEVD